MSDAHSILTRDDGATIGYRRRDGKSPGVLFLCGFNSDMSGTKAESLDAFCAARGHSFVRFDYFAHGVSSGDFADVTIGRLLGDTLAVIDKLTNALHVALKDDNVKQRFAELGTEPVAENRATPAALRAFLKAEIDKWSPIIKKAGVYAD